MLFLSEEQSYICTVQIPLNIMFGPLKYIGRAALENIYGSTQSGMIRQRSIKV